MSGLVNLIKSLFSGIFGFIGGFLGGKQADKSLEPAPQKNKKRSGYFLEFDDTQNNGATNSTAVALVEAPAAEQPMTVSKETLVDAAKVELTNADATSGKKSSRKEKLAALAAADKPAAGKSATATADKTADDPQSVPATVAVAPLEPDAEHAFASKYLIPTNTGTRRRPGANMTSYLEMARKMNVG